MTTAEILAAAREIVAAADFGKNLSLGKSKALHREEMDALHLSMQEICRELLRLHDGGEWSSEPPTEPGDYFWRKTMSDKPRTRHVGVWPGDKSLVVGTDSNEERILFGGIATVAQIGGFWLSAEPATAMMLAELRAEVESSKSELERYIGQYKEAHRRLDAASVPPAAGVACDDPNCDSHLVHRVHTLISERDCLTGELAEAKAALSESVTHCGWCKGTTINLNTGNVCPACKPARDLLTKLGVKL